jgi:hypothetical protein
MTILLRHLPVVIALTLAIFGLQKNQAEAQDLGSRQPSHPLFDSTADTVFDIIHETDPTTFSCLEYIGREERQIWDKRVNGEPIINTFVFVSQYSDGTSIQIALNPEFDTVETAREEALRYVNALGQLPTALRKGIRRLSIHKGRRGFHAGDEQIVMYAGMTDHRLSYNHLEESVFHESVHASWDAQHRLSTGWKNAQARDGQFLTKYGQKSPEREDLAETALFAYAILHHPGRIPPVDTEDTLRTVPHRIAYIKELLPPGSPLHYKIQAAKDCAAETQ